jgi:hypothetical protein
MVAEALTAGEAVFTEAAVACAEADPACHPRHVRVEDMLAERGVLLLHLELAPIGQMQDRVVTVIAPTPIRRMESEVAVLPHRFAPRRTASGIHLAAGLEM